MVVQINEKCYGRQTVAADGVRVNNVTYVAQRDRVPLTPRRPTRGAPWGQVNGPHRKTVANWAGGGGGVPTATTSQREFPAGLPFPR